MKKSELKQIIKEEINLILNESFNILSKEFGGYDDTEFLKIIWKLPVPELEKILDESKSKLNWMKKQGPSGKIMGSFNRRDILIIKSRIQYLSEVIFSKKKNPNYMPDFVR